MILFAVYACRDARRGGAQAFFLIDNRRFGFAFTAGTHTQRMP